MTTLKQRPGDQPLPVPNDRPDIQSLAIADIVERRQIGIERYGTALQPFNGRSALRDLYEELLDAVMYTRQLIEEDDERLTADDVAERYRELLTDDEEFASWVCRKQFTGADTATVRAVLTAMLAELTATTQAGQAGLAGQEAATPLTHREQLADVENLLDAALTSLLDAQAALAKARRSDVEGREFAKGLRSQDAEIDLDAGMRRIRSVQHRVAARLAELDEHSAAEQVAKVRSILGDIQDGRVDPHDAVKLITEVAEVAEVAEVCEQAETVSAADGSQEPRR